MGNGDDISWKAGAPATRGRVSKRAKFLNPRFSSLALSGAHSLFSEAPVDQPARPPHPPKLPMAVGLEGNAQEKVLNSNDMLKILFSSLELSDLCSAATVSKQWQVISQAEEFWQDISFEDRNVTRTQVEDLLSRHRGLTSLNLSGLRFADEQLLSHIHAQLNLLNKLELGSHPLSEGQLNAISQLQVLTWLQISDSNLGRFGPGEVVIAHDNLTTLKVVSCRVTRLAVRCKNLTGLSLKNTALSALLPSCPKLTCLDLKACSKIRDTELRSALIRLPKLTHLDLTANLPLSDDTLREVASTCTKITHLSLSNCIAVSLNSVRGFGALRHLNLSSCDSLTAATTLPVLESFTALEEIIMDGCSLLTQVTLSLPRLVSLSLRGCRSLESIKLHCRSLEELCLGPIEAGGPGCGSLKIICLLSSAVKTITWRAFPMLQTVRLCCPNLLHLDLSDCDSLQDSIFHCVVDDLDYPALPHPPPPPEDLDPVLAMNAPDANGHAHDTHRSENIIDMSREFGEPVTVDRPPRLSNSEPSVQQSHRMRNMTQLLQSASQRFELHKTRGKAARGMGIVDGCPRLRSLRLDCCEGLRVAQLSSTSLTSLSLAGCKGLSKVSLDCPAMDDLHLEECDQVEAVELANVAVSQMSLGTCPALCSLRASAPFLTLLDLKGCGMLEHLNLNCPSLTTLDATFCGSLGDDALAGALAASPPLEELTLSVCSALGQQGLRSLSSLACLTRLDLSYTEVDDLGPVAVACPQLQVLNLSSCSCLPPDALEALMPRIGGSEARASSSTTPSTATLTSLNVSYCPLPVTSLSRVLAAASSLESLAINGCSGLNDGVWEGLEGLGNGLPHALKYLSLVGCKGLHSCTLGLKKLDSHTWQPYVTRLSQLQELRLGLSGISTLALALPTLTMLDANSCCSLKELELQCPLLLAAYFQACQEIKGQHLRMALKDCDQLEILDAQHMDASKEVLQEIRRDCQSLRCLLHTNP